MFAHSESCYYIRASVAGIIMTTAYSKLHPKQNFVEREFERLKLSKTIKNNGYKWIELYDGTTLLKRHTFGQPSHRGLSNEPLI